mgnify:FL=1
MSEKITVRFDGVGWAEAYPVVYEAFQEAYQVHTFTNKEYGNHREYDAIMKTIHWGMQQGFTVLSVDGKRLEIISPKIDGDLVKSFRFVKDYARTLGGDEE